MIAEELKSRICGILNERCSAQLYLILRYNDKFVMRLANTNDNETIDEIKKMYTDFINESIVLNEDLVIRSLSSADVSLNSIYLYDYDSYPEELELFKSFDIGTAINTEKFNFSEDSLRHLYGYIIYIGDMYNGITLLKKHYPISLISRESFLLGARKSTERFEKLPSDDIIRLSANVQMIKIDNIVYILDLEMLERNTGFTELTRKAASESLAEIERLDIIDDIQVLRDTLYDVSFARKLSRIKTASPIFSLGISKEMIIDFTKNTPELAGKFKYSEDGSKIRLDTKKSKDLFLKLMNDAFLRSELTKQYYEASSKDRIL